MPHADKINAYTFVYVIMGRTTRCEQSVANLLTTRDGARVINEQFLESMGGSLFEYFVIESSEFSTKLEHYPPGKFNEF